MAKTETLKTSVVIFNMMKDTLGVNVVDFDQSTSIYLSCTDVINLVSNINGTIVLREPRLADNSKGYPARGERIAKLSNAGVGVLTIIDAGDGKRVLKKADIVYQYETPVDTEYLVTLGAGFKQHLEYQERAKSIIFKRDTSAKPASFTI